MQKQFIPNRFKVFRNTKNNGNKNNWIVFIINSTICASMLLKKQVVEFINMFEEEFKEVEDMIEEFKEDEVAVAGAVAVEEELTPEVRRQQVRDSWVKRFS